MFCMSCGSSNPEGAKFCIKCGAALTYQIPKSEEFDNSGMEQRIHVKRSEAAYAILNSAIIAVAILLVGAVGYLGYLYLPTLMSITQEHSGGIAKYDNDDSINDTLVENINTNEKKR